MTHHTLSPSKFPAWSLCPCFDSDPTERADATAGTAQHAALAALLTGDAVPLASLHPDAAEAVQWAGGYIRALAADDAQIEAEKPVSYTAPDAFADSGRSEVYSGTADAVIVHAPGNTADLADYKSGSDERDHRPQMCGYALALFSMRPRLKVVRCHVLYGRVRRADSFSVTQADAAGVVLPILEARQSERRTQTACGYCPLCANRATCPAITDQVRAVASTAPDWERLAPAVADPAAVTDPALAAAALTVARYVSAWADAIRERATELAKGGATLPGWRLQERRGARDVADIEAAFSRTGLTPEQFRTACKLSLPKLADAYAAAHAMPKKKAAAEIEALLSGLVEERAPSVSLVPERET